MRIVIDASVALKWVVSEDDSEMAVALQAEDLIAPVIWLAEVGNVLWRRVRLGEITGEEAVLRLAGLTNSPITSFRIEPLLDRALKLALVLDHPIYDCLYLALALVHEAHVVTADRRFATVGNRPDMAGRVRLLGT